MPVSERLPTTSGGRSDEPRRSIPSAAAEIQPPRDRRVPGPDVEARERFLRQASAEGHSRSTLKRIAWALFFVATTGAGSPSVSGTLTRWNGS
jgi:hypothetical protein